VFRPSPERVKIRVAGGRHCGAPSRDCGVNVYISDPSTIPDLLDWLSQRPDVIAERVGKHEVEVSLLGSRQAPWNAMELELRLRAWEAARGTSFEIRAE
jgi:hypothetical protein